MGRSGAFAYLRILEGVARWLQSSDKGSPSAQYGGA